MSLTGFLPASTRPLIHSILICLTMMTLSRKTGKPSPFHQAYLRVVMHALGRDIEHMYATCRSS